MAKHPKRSAQQRKNAARPSRKKLPSRAREIATSSRVACLVLGMHRSGTSAVTRIINLLGADLPKNLLSANTFNERGYWESDDFVAINDRILASAGSAWGDWRPINRDWFRSAECESFKPELLEILQNNFSNSRLFVIKDPRICRISPLWLDVLQQFGAHTTAVIPIRNPLEVAGSLKARDGFSSAISHLLWLRYLCDAEYATREVPRAVIDYEDLFDGWRDVVETISARTQIVWPSHTALAEIEIDRFIEQRLRHFIAEPGQLTVQADISDWIKSAYAALVQMSRHAEDEASRQQLDRIRVEFDNAFLMFEPALKEKRTGIGVDVPEKLKAASEQVQIVSRPSEDPAATQARLAERDNADDENATENDDLPVARIDVEREKTVVETLREQLALEREQAAQREREVHRLTLAIENLNATHQQVNAIMADVAKRDSERSGASNANQYSPNIKREMEVLRVFLRDSQSQMQRLSGELDEVQRDLAQSKSEITRKNLELANVTNQLTRASSELAVSDERLSVANESVRQGEAELAESINQNQAELARVRDDLQSAQAEISSWQNVLLVNQRTIEQLASELTSGQNELKNIQNEFKIIQRENISITSQLKSESLNLSQRDDELSQLRNAHTIERELNADLRHSISVQASDIDQAKNSIWWRIDNTMREIFGRHSSLKQRRVGSRGWESNIIVKSKLFHTAWYLEENPDVLESGQDALEHYLLHGAKEGRRPHPLFDQEWYVTRYSEVAKSKMSPLAHYVSVGVSEGLDPHPLFDTSWYLQQNPDIAATHQNPLFHYMKYGGFEGRNPHPLFDSAWYLAKNSDVAVDQKNPLFHFLTHGAAEGRHPHPLFDTDCYRSRYLGPSKKVQNALVHYLSMGADRGFSPHPLFDSAWYLEKYPDVAASGENPLVHFVTKGGKDAFDPHPLFDTAWYCANNPGAASAPEGPFAHYMAVGGLEGLDPHPLFDSDWYLEKNPDAKEAGINPFAHYILHGNEEGRDPHPLFRRVYIEQRYGMTFPHDISPLAHFLKISRERDVDPCAMFDSALYRYQVEIEQQRNLGDIPIIDYLKTGYQDKRVLPNIIFDPLTYLEANAVEVVGPELVHYALIGDRLGYSTHPHFSAAVYNANRSDSGATAIEHFFTADPESRPTGHQHMMRALPEEVIGFIKQTVEFEGFDEMLYRALYPDIEGQYDLFHHYEMFGRAEGRAGSGRELLRDENIHLRDIPLGFYWNEYLNLNIDFKGSIAAEFGPLFLHYVKHGRKENRMIGNWQLYIDAQKYIISASPSPLAIIPAAKKGNVCVLMHLFHPDLLGELVAYAQSFDELLSDVFINVVDQAWSIPFHREIRQSCPGAFVMVSRNAGRDIGGFLRLLGSVDIQGYELFAWMHTKKSPHIAPEKGEYWRRRLLNAFAGSKEIAERCVRLFHEDASIGLVACKEWRDVDLGRNETYFNRLLNQFEINEEHHDVEYVSGTMFIIRSEIVQRLYNVLKDTQFESGDAASLEFNIDGQMAHAVERVIGNVVRQMGYRIEWVEA